LLRRAEARVRALTPPLRRAYARWVETQVDVATRREVLGLLAQGNVDGAFARIVADPVVVGAAKRVRIEWQGALAKHAQWATRELPKALRAPGALWDPSAVEARAWVAQWTDKLFATQTASFKASLRALTNYSLEQRLTTGELSSAVRSMYSLTAHDVRIVANYRAELLRGDANALRRVLRDARRDPTVRKALESGKPLTSEQVERAVAHYADALRSWRADAYVRTLGQQAQRAGQQTAYEQAVVDMGVDRSQVVRVWWTSEDEEVRESHAQMHGVEVGLDEPWQVPGVGPQMVPGEDEWNCRCVVVYRVTGKR
jgi:hypothetical protein